MIRIAQATSALTVQWLLTKGGATIFKVGVKQDITVFITAIMTYKRLCLPAPNDYNIGMCDYCGYGETETVKECHF